MDYKNINDKWKLFLAENTFKEDALVKKPKKKKKGKKELIVSEKECMEEDVNCREEKELDEMSGMSGGAVQGYAGNAFDNKEED